MKLITQIIAIVVLANALVATIFHSWIYNELDSFLYDGLSQQLIDAKKETDNHLKSITPFQWQQKAMELGIQLDTQATIEQMDSLDIDVSILDQIKPGRGTIIDDTMPMLYYPLNNEQAMVIGPISTSTGMGYLTEWISWLAGMIVSSIVVTLVLIRREKEWDKIRDVLKLFPGVDEKYENGRIEDILVQLRRSHSEQSEIQNERLISQRDLLHGVAHEFRSPMARMQFALDMLADCDEEQRDALISKIEKSLHDLDDLVKELLYYSRLKHEQNPLQLSWLSLNELVPQVINLVQPFYPSIRFEVDIESESMVQADKSLLRRLLTNILRNAGRFADDFCRVSTRVLDVNIEICIQDDGPGIPPGKSKRIFEPFTRLDPSRSRDSGGCGLGLAIVDSIANKHNATIEVDNSEFGGAKFTIIFPR